MGKEGSPMNSEAASETQYEDSKSQLSTYRKDDKIMLEKTFVCIAGIGPRCQYGGTGIGSSSFRQLWWS